MTDVPLSLKYRPKKFSEVVGQNLVVQGLTNAIKNKKLHHAYIFGGVLGTGKTSLARILAASENCIKGKFDPCGECKNCQEIFTGKSNDVKELDGASNRGIDDIRELKKEIQFASVSGKVRYLIIDEAHALSGAAAEASLKMLEEPPKNVRFILCTTEPQNIKDTIHSRCISYKLSKVSPGDIFDYLKKVSDSEKFTYSEDALRTISRISGGSLRTSLQNLQKAHSYNGNVDIESVNVSLGVKDQDIIYNYINALIKRDMPLAMSCIFDLLQDGSEVRMVVADLESYLRSLMLALTVKDLSKYGYTDVESKRITHQANSISDSNRITIVIEWMKLLYDLCSGIDLNLDPQILLERIAIESMIIRRKYS